MNNIKCYICKRLYGYKEIKGGGITHSICPECFPGERKKLNQVRVEMGLNPLPDDWKPKEMRGVEGRVYAS